MLLTTAHILLNTLFLLLELSENRPLLFSSLKHLFKQHHFNTISPFAHLIQKTPCKDIP